MPPLLILALSVGVFATIGIIRYAIHESNKMKYGKGRGGSSRGGESNYVSTYDDIKPDYPKCSSGGRPADPKHTGGKLSADPKHTGGKLSDDPKHPGGKSSLNDHKSPSGRSDNPQNNPGHGPTNEGLRHRNTDSSTALEKGVLSRRKVSLTTELQASASVSIQPELIGWPSDINSNSCDNYSDKSSDMSSSSSLSDFDSVAESVDDFIGNVIPVWSEMSSHERSECLCNACEDQVSNLAIPCGHPYMCNECAGPLFKMYTKCPLCQRSISGYENIYQ